MFLSYQLLTTLLNQNKLLLMSGHGTLRYLLIVEYLIVNLLYFIGET